MMPEPVILKAIMWIAVLLSLPAIWWAFSVIGSALAKVLFPQKVIMLTVVEGGIEKKKAVRLDDTDALVQAILNMKGKPCE